MNFDPGILCFQHLEKEGRVFCFQVPEKCAFCQEDLGNADLRVTPFRIPYPFVRATQYPNSVVIRPTKGDFLHDYVNSTDLHIGVTDSRGWVYEYDVNGLHVGKSNDWNQSLAITLDRVVGKDATEWQTCWDTTLKTMAKQEEKWNKNRYKEDEYNCYTFVLTFLHKLRHPILSKMATNKMEFCERFIVPKTTTAGKYISVYRKLRETGVFVYKY